MGLFRPLYLDVGITAKPFETKCTNSMTGVVTAQKAAVIFLLRHDQSFVEIFVGLVIISSLDLASAT